MPPAQLVEARLGAARVRRVRRRGQVGPETVDDLLDAREEAAERLLAPGPGLVGPGRAGERDDQGAGQGRERLVCSIRSGSWVATIGYGLAAMSVSSARA